ncbi:NAD(P)/FAD-dependent oxidoreductase [Planctomicrobium sp. SH661]|uniref:NAD(P)/FAD-dependent oxidoreductase n=1 Tax=Planctomicrobium sp. SH661 TaxID=3448124 RepID=UPI003F5B4905
MDLKSASPFWPIKEGLLATYPPLTRDENCEVVVVGAGITGALVADELSRRGMDVVVLDRRDVGQGSTSATTGLLQYEIDVHLCDLIGKVGRAHAERAYLLCLDSISQLERLAGECRFPCGFQGKTSLYAASRRRDVRELEKEHAARRACGINVELLKTPEEISRYGLNQPALLVSHDAAVCNAFSLAHGLLQNAIDRGARVYDRTTATQFIHSGEGVRVETDRGPDILAGRIIFANGYESQRQAGVKVAKLKSTYALVTQPLEDVSPWNRDWIFWETARPYFYMRTTEDDRLLVGGEDDSFRNPARRDARISVKVRKLMKRLNKLIPDQDLEPEYAWAGTFGETADGLAYIGPSPRDPYTSFALCFGGNGITFSVIAARILADQLTGTPNPDGEIFRFGR